MAYLIKSLGWKDREVQIFVLAHIVLLGWAIALILNTKYMSLGSLVINYAGILFFGAILFKKTNQLDNKKNNELEG